MTDPGNKSFTVYLKGSPYASSSVLTACGILSAAADRGHRIRMMVSGEAMQALLRNRKYANMPDAGMLLGGLVKKGLEIYICGNCVGYRRVSKKDYIEGVKIVKAKACLKLIGGTDVLINL